MTAKRDTSNFFQHAKYDEEYWNNYLATRPEYDQQFYQSLYDYHRAGAACFDTAHDVATGPGQVALELSKHFAKVIASDTNTTHLEVARHRLGDTIRPASSAEKIELILCPAEELGKEYTPRSTDFIAAAECIPLLDAQIALDNFYNLLSPGGTLAIWFYGRPIFAEPRYAKTCQPLYDTIADTLFSKVIKGGGPQHQAGWKRASNRLASFCDDVDLSSTGQWIDVQRIKWNADYPMSFYSPQACDFPVETVSHIDWQKETVHKVDDLTFWHRRWDIAGVKRFLYALLPAFDKTASDDEVEKLFEELAVAMGGVDQTRDITWPVILILARKK